jgi:hypothetical protein
MIYVLIPAHNEAATVGLLLWKVRQVFTAFSREYQLIVVNDGSTDGSDEILEPYSRALPLTLLANRKRQGYGRSLEALFREALRRTDRPRRDLAVTLQADFSESPDDLPELIKCLEGGADLAVGVHGSNRPGGFVSHTLLGFARRLAGVRGAANLVGTIRGYRLAVLDKLLRESGQDQLLLRDGWAADAELLLKASRHARRIESVPLAGSVPPGRRTSRVSPLGAAWAVVRASLALRNQPAARMPARALEVADAEERAEPVADAGGASQGRRTEQGDHQARGERAGQRPGGPPAAGEKKRERGGSGRRHRRNRDARRGRGGGLNEPRPPREAATLALEPTEVTRDRPAAAPAVGQPPAEGTTSPEREPRGRRRRRGGRGRGRGRRGGGGRAAGGAGEQPPSAA